MVSYKERKCSIGDSKSSILGEKARISTRRTVYWTDTLLILYDKGKGLQKIWLDIYKRNNRKQNKKSFFRNYGRTHWHCSFWCFGIDEKSRE